MSNQDIFLRFDNKKRELEKTLPDIKELPNCAELTLTNILDVLGIDNFLFHNLAIPLAGGFGGFKSLKGWKAPCGAVCGGAAAIGVIVGGQKKKMNNNEELSAYRKAAIFAHNFEKQFESVSCEHLCGTDWSDMNSINKYMKNRIWQKTCYNYVIFAIDQVRNLTQKELSKKWK